MEKIVVSVNTRINKINLVALFPEQLAEANKHLAMLNFPPTN